MSNPPPVSVIVPCFNAEKTLGACLDSICSQTLKIHEILVVDDRSADQSREIASGYPCHLIELPVNQGVSAARNAGVAASTGEILFFLDADEALEPDAIENAVRLLADGYDCVHGIIAAEPLIDDGPVEWYKTLHAYWWRQAAVGPVRTAFFAQTAMPRAVFDAVGPFDETLRDSEDLEYSDRLAPRPILLTDQVVARHDEADRLVPLLREQFRRSQLLARTVLGARRKGRASLTANRPLGILAVAGSLASLPLGLVSAAWLAVPVALLLFFCGVNAGLLRFAASRKGAAFALFFIGVHLLTHVALVAGAAVGLLRWRFRQILTAATVLAAITALGLALRRDGASAVAALAQPRALPWLAAALLANAAGLGLGVLAWHRLLDTDRARLPGAAAAKVFFLGQLGKYLPGRIWGVVTHVQHGRDRGISAGRMTSAYFLSILLTILTGSVAGLLVAPAALGRQAGWLAVPVAALLLFAGWPEAALRPLVSLAGRYRRRIELPSRGAIRRSAVLALVSWLVSGLHLWALAAALGADPGLALLPAMGGFALATVSGSLAFIVPDGWGVREVVIMTALATVLPWGTAGAVAISSRVVCVVVEVLLSLAVLATARTSRRVESVQAVQR